MVSMESSPQAHAKSFESKRDFSGCAAHWGMVSGLCVDQKGIFFSFLSLSFASGNWMTQKSGCKQTTAVFLVMQNSQMNGVLLTHKGLSYSSDLGSGGHLFSKSD